MKNFLLLILAGMLLSHPACGGTITGTVRARGVDEAADKSAGGQYDSRKLKFVEKVNYAALKDFVVFIEGQVGDKPAVPEKSEKVETSRNKITQDGGFLIGQVILFLLQVDNQHVDLVVILDPVINHSNPAAFATALRRITQHCECRHRL